jgi:hypothetical protein
VYLHSSNIKHLIGVVLIFSVDALVSPIIHVKPCEEFYSFVHAKTCVGFLDERICMFFSSFVGCALFFP